MQNSWVYSNHAAITCTLYSENARIWCDYGVTFVHVLTYLLNPRTLSKKAMVGKNIVSKLEYSPVKKIRESEVLLVRQCSSCLGEYITLWVVSILMYTQELHNFFLCLLCHMPATWSKYKYNLPANICTFVHPRISNILINNTNCTSVHPRISNILINNTNCMPMISSASTRTTTMMYCSTFLWTT